MQTPTFVARAMLLGCLLAAGCGGNSSGLPQSTTAAADPGVPQAPPVERVQLRLQLHVGDRFPLRKVVEQELIQKAGTNDAADTSRSRLEMLLAITVEGAGEGGSRLAVQYDRIRYRRDGGRHPVEYDSAQPPLALPLELAAYQGMVGHGFSFWIGADNRITRTEGFAEFVQAALAQVPPESRDEVLLGVEAGTGEDGVTDFIDDTIGLLPVDESKAAGESWRRTRRIARPVPMHIDTLCTLRELTDEFAVVDVRGDVTPLLSTGIQAVAHKAMQVLVERGTTVGECVLFRDSGLPKESRIVQEFDITITQPGQAPVLQRKRVVTSIESYPTR
ncbi:MAG: hypothetical protein JNG89_19905 [Planctomycetaceae bacterium]|nr:hypothetical protein [Planctomycetaceae bacterium]